MKLSDEISQLDGLSQAELIKKGEITAAEVLEAVIARIEAINPQLNAVVTPMYEQARQMAQQDHSESIFAGIPILLKDLGTMYAGARMTGGSAALADLYPTVDSEVVIRMKKAGLNIAGKTNTPEFGLQPTTESHFLGACRNPWELSRSPGGSSGGAAAAVAAGMVPLAHASDGGGSIRIPASCCGLFGLKPTRARIPRGPLMGDSMNGLSTDGCVSRTVRDSAAFLDAVAGPELGDPYWAPPQSAPYLSEVGKSPRKLRIAYTTVAPSGAPIHPECVAAVEATAQLCTSLGHDVEEASPQIDAQQFNDTFVAMWAAGCSWTLNSISRMKQGPPNPSEYEPFTWALYEMGQGITSGQYLLAVQWMQQLSRQVAHFFTKYDLWLTPTLAEPPLPLGTFEAESEPLDALQRAISFVPFTPLANATGQPAMSVPLHWTADNLPVGSHFMGRFGDEATLFRLAAQLETARPWAKRRPALR